MDGYDPVPRNVDLITTDSPAVRENFDRLMAEGCPGCFLKVVNIAYYNDDAITYIHGEGNHCRIMARGLALLLATIKCPILSLLPNCPRCHYSIIHARVSLTTGAQVFC